MTTVSARGVHPPECGAPACPCAAAVGSDDGWPVSALLPATTAEGEPSFWSLVLAPGTRVSVLDEHPEGPAVPPWLRLVVVRVDEGRHKGSVVEVLRQQIRCLGGDAGTLTDPEPGHPRARRPPCLRRRDEEGQRWGPHGAAS